MLADKPFGLTFLDDVGATYVQVSYFKLFGGPPDGKEDFLFGGILWGLTFVGTIKGGYSAIGHVPGWGMRGGTDDIELAYRQCPVRTPQFVVACLVDPSSGEARFFVLPGMAFGHTASVNQFNRLPELVVHFLRRRCGVACTHYFDDYVTCEPSFAGSSGQDLLLLVHTSIGMPLSAEKHEPMSELFVFLGVLTDFTAFAARRVITMRPKPGRLESVLKALAIIVAAGAINYGQASTLRGKLQFLLCTVGFGSRPAKSVLAAFAAVRRGGFVVTKTNKPRERPVGDTIREDDGVGKG